MVALTVVGFLSMTKKRNNETYVMYSDIFNEYEKIINQK